MLSNNQTKQPNQQPNQQPVLLFVMLSIYIALYTLHIGCFMFVFWFGSFYSCLLFAIVGGGTAAAASSVVVVDSTVLLVVVDTVYIHHALYNGIDVLLCTVPFRYMVSFESNSYWFTYIVYVCLSFSLPLFLSMLMFCSSILCSNQSVRISTRPN